MVVVPLAKPADTPSEVANVPSAAVVRRVPEPNWLRYAAAGTLAASGVLLVAGQKRAGLIVAASGAALAMLDQKEAVGAWWSTLPGFLEEMSATLGKAQTAVQDLSTQGQKLREMLHCG
jgi:hypothetical protein